MLDLESDDDETSGLVGNSSRSNSSTTVLAVVLALVSGVCHATSALFTVFAVNVGFSEFQIIFVSTVAGSLTSLLVVKLGRYSLLVEDSLTTFLLLANGVVMLLGDASYIYAVQWAPLGDTTTIVNASMPVMTAFLSYIILKETWTILDATCAILSIFGIILITCPSFVFDRSSSLNDNFELEAYSLAIFAGLCYSLSPVLIRKMMNTNVFVIIFYQFAVDALLSLPLMYIVENPSGHPGHRVRVI
ncbi:solute carrier family 35 member G1-like [Ptychodera flava]|uniref:solute carrier family 35 member G1-like n=1 Tax=Ptychodera flava TaxID=63121 RepID=UPI003969C60C